MARVGHSSTGGGGELTYPYRVKLNCLSLQNAVLFLSANDKFLKLRYFNLDR